MPHGRSGQVPAGDDDLVTEAERDRLKAQQAVGLGACEASPVTVAVTVASSRCGHAAEGVAADEERGGGETEEFPRFMGGVLEVRQLDDRNVHWVAEIAGVRREWDATILEQVPDEKVMWAATHGATNAGAVYFQALGPARTRVRLTLEYEPTGLVETMGDKLNLVERQAEADLEKFKVFIESEGHATGTWRGSVNEGLNVEPTADIADATKDDDGKAGISPKAMVAGAAAAAAGVAAARSLRSGEGDADAQVGDQGDPDVVVVEELEIVDVVPTTDDDIDTTRSRETGTPPLPPV